jgi:hypothetical protein
LTARLDDGTVVVRTLAVRKNEGQMYARSNAAKAAVVSERNDDAFAMATERYERRLAEESGKLRVEMAGLRVEMAEGFGGGRTLIATEIGGLRAEMQAGFGNLRAEMIHRNAEMLKWILGFLVLQLAAIAGLLALFR